MDGPLFHRLSLILIFLMGVMSIVECLIIFYGTRPSICHRGTLAKRPRTAITM